MPGPRIVITCGDVNGIGLRCLAEAVRQAPLPANLTLIIPPDVLEQAMSVYNLPGELSTQGWMIGDTCIAVQPIDVNVDLAPGQAHDDAARAAIASLEFACATVGSGGADAMVTLPISKHALQQVGWPYPGQTEMIAAHATGEPLMVLCTRTLHVALATVHVPIRDVADMLSTALIERRLRTLHDHLQQRVGISTPRIAVLGLNPHAGEQGAIGNEDEEIIRPAVQRMMADGISVAGPFPADGFFGFGAYQVFDGVLAMYHDQGLIPLKLLARGAGVNVTAGLSILRTSPDHGTAYDRISAADIDASSTRLAIEMAIDLRTSNS